jgi:hypothetical protein
MTKPVPLCLAVATAMLGSLMVVQAADQLPHYGESADAPTGADGEGASLQDYLWSDLIALAAVVFVIVLIVLYCQQK